MSTQPSGLYAPYERLIKITVLGKTVEVPENNILLRGFQFVSPTTIPYGRFCWNEECQYCRVSVTRAGGEKVQQALSCKLMVEEGMEINELSAELAYNLLQLFRPDPPDSSEPAGADEAPPAAGS